MRTFARRRWKWLFFTIVVMIVALGAFHYHAVLFQVQRSLSAAKTLVAATDSSLVDHVVIPNSKEAAQQAAVQQIASPQTTTQQNYLLTSNNPPKIYYRNKVAVLTYHHLDSQESSVTITPERFESHLETLKNYGYHVISVEDFIDFLQKKKPVPPNAVVITFDDGYESVYKYAYPLLKKEGMTATVFLVVGYIEDGTTRLPPILTWSEIEEMHKDGFSFYSHSYNSHETVIVKGKDTSELIAKKVNPSTMQLETDSEYRARITNDLTKADDILNAKLGNRMNLLCLPHGQYNQSVVQLANQAGIPFLFTGVEGINSDKDKLIKRINAGSPYMSDKLLIRKLATSK